MILSLSFFLKGSSNTHLEKMYFRLVSYCQEILVILFILGDGQSIKVLLNRKLTQKVPLCNLS
jgi:hypothetical protein